MLPLHALRGNRAAIEWIRHSWWLVFSPKRNGREMNSLSMQNRRDWPSLPCRNIAAQMIHPNEMVFSSAIRSFWSPDRIHRRWPYHCRSYRIIEMQFCTGRRVCIANLRMLEIQRMKWDHLCSYRQCPLIMLRNPGIEINAQVSDSFGNDDWDIDATNLVEIFFGEQS